MSQKDKIGQNRWKTDKNGQANVLKTLKTLKTVGNMSKKDKNGQNC